MENDVVPDGTRSSADDPTAMDGGRLGLRTLAVVAVLYVIAALVATDPVARDFRTRLAGGRCDPLQHLWIMRWYKSCLFEGRLPFVCPEAQYPVGAPLGNFSPMGFQSLCYIPLSMVIANDTLCFNLLWLFGVVTTGLATFALAWTVTRHRVASAVGGLMAMLSAPMMLHSMGHLELIHLGCVPLFLMAWMRFVDRPSRGTLALAVGAFALTAFCAAYYAVFVIVPAAMYATWALAGAGWRGVLPWLRGRIVWFVAFGVLGAASSLPAFANQIWAKSHGLPMDRPFSEFAHYNAPLWTYVVPSYFHRLSACLPTNLFQAAGYGIADGERASYLGVVTLLLLNYAAMRRVGFRRAGFWWTLGLVLVVLACGASWHFGPHKIMLPGAWLKRRVPGFGMIRVPARFNLFVVVIAAVIAAAALKDLLGRLTTRTARTALVLGLLAVAMFDLSIVSYPTSVIPPLPRGYTEILRRDPSATFLEVPQVGSGGSDFNAVTGYWQSQHRAPSNAAYSGQRNFALDDRIAFNSPFAEDRLTDPAYPSDSAPAMDILGPVDFLDYSWIYLTANEFRYVVVHKSADFTREKPVHLEGLMAALAPAKVFEDDETAIYAREKLAAPTHPVLLGTSGWRYGWPGPYRVVAGEGRMALYVPESSGPIRLAMKAEAYRKPRSIRLTRGAEDLARWELAPGPATDLSTADLNLPPGLHDLALSSGGASRPANRLEAVSDHDRGPIGLRVRALNLTAPASQIAEQPAKTPRR